MAGRVDWVAGVDTSAGAERAYSNAELERERRESRALPDAERAEVDEIFRERARRGARFDQVVAQITADPRVWVDE